ncbi:MAG TPA: bifunctional glycosyltransferase family 2/GtrA family protein [Motilibacteraceae bacterium]|nr:bifunctional glycosyltransferase family 2/GtrA family protein [Motilibacteraceae bacterium]
MPVLDEERDLERCVRTLHAYLREHLPWPAQVTVVDNGSTDATPHIAAALAAELDGVRLLRLDQRGRGRALATAWRTSGAQVLCYLDVDLSTDLAALLPLVAPLVAGHSDLAIGTRLAPGARTVRGPKRELVSRSYNLILRTALRARFSDAQCGFKAIRADAAQALLPLVEDTGWFFDTELLVLAERAGLRIHEVPVDWVDDPDSRVDLVATALADLRGIWRLGRGLAVGTLRDRLAERVPAVRHDRSLPPGMAGQLARFAGIGALSTLAYALLFTLLRPVAGPQAANLLALLVTAVANTAANRRVTFGVTGSGSAWRHHLQGMGVFALGLAVTSGALAALHAVVAAPAVLLELTVLVLASALATVLRFVLLRQWVFRAVTSARGR